MYSEKNSYKFSFYRKNRVPIIIISGALFVFGLISLFSLDFNLIPDIEYPELVVVTYYPNAASEQVKNLVTVPIERMVGSLKGMKTVHTLSRDGMSVARIRYRWGENLTTSHIELREKLDLAGAFFPREVKRPIIVNYQTSRDAVIGISIVSGTMDPRSLYLLCIQDVVPVFEKTDGVARVDVEGGERPEVQVMLDPEKLVKYNLGVNEVSEALRLSNKSVGVGTLRDNEYEYLIRVDGDVTDYRELEDIVVKKDEKRLVSLRDVAEVKYGIEDKDTGIRIDGQDALMFSVYKRPNAGILRVSGRIDEQIKRLNARYNGDIFFQKIFDESMYIKKSLRELIAAITLGILFTVFSVYLFIGSMRLSFIVIITIPLSMFATFIIMKLAGVSINLLTLGGFSLAVGMIVDNAVIVMTAVVAPGGKYSNVDGGIGPLELDDQGFSARIRRVVPAVFSATLTTVVVFLPVFILTGILKHVFFQLSLVILVSLLFSLVFSVTLVPVFLQSVSGRVGRNTLKGFCPPVYRKLVEGSGPHKKAESPVSGNHQIEPATRNEFCLHMRPAPMEEKTVIKLTIIYAKLLTAVFKSRIFFLIALFSIICLGVFSYGPIDKRFLESFPQDWFYVKLFIKKPVPYEYTARFTGYVIDTIAAGGNIKKIIARIGIDRMNVENNLDGIYGTNTAILKVYTDTAGDAVYNSIRQVREKLDYFTGVDFLVTVPDSPVQRLLLRSDFDARIKLYDPSPDILADAVGLIREYVEKTNIGQDILTSYYMPHTEHSILLKRDEMALYRVNAVSLAEFISAAVSGLRVGTWKRGEYEIPILLRFPFDSVSDIGDILDLSIKNSDGKEVRLKELVYVKQTDASRFMLRENQTTFAKLDFNIKERTERRSLFSRSFSQRKQMESFLQSKKFSYIYQDRFTLLRENYREILLSLFIAIFLEYVILASGFRSLSKPLLVIAMIPLSVPGILFILYMLNFSLNINTFMSILVLIGLLVNNAIMLFLEYGSGKVRDENEIIIASTRRLKPILITTVSTILALVPTLFTGNRIQVSLASTLIFGLLYSTGITLLYMPLLYSIFYLRKNGKR